MTNQRGKAGSNATIDVVAKVRRIDTLFKAMSTDFLLREQFVTDPAQILSEYVLGRPIEKEQGAAFNKLIYAVVVETPLFRWLAEYAGKQRGPSMPSREQFVDDFSDAVIATRSGKAARMLMGLGLSETRSVELNEDVIHPLLLTLTRYVELGSRGRLGVGRQTLGQLTGTGPTTGTVTAGNRVLNLTEASTGNGTEINTGTDSGTEVNGTQISTGTGTDTGTNTGTEMSTGTDSGTEASGTQISTGTGTDTGTEVSTGTDSGTEASGTQISTGTGTGTDDSGTEVSGTQISTGTDGGTEMSTEGGGGTDQEPPGARPIDWWDIIRHITLGTATVNGPPTIGGTHVPPGPPPWELRELFGATYAATTLEALFQFATIVSEAGLLRSDR